MESGRPRSPEDFFLLRDEGEKIALYVSRKIHFRDGRILVEHFTYRGRDVFICRTATL